MTPLEKLQPWLSRQDITVVRQEGPYLHLRSSTGTDFVARVIRKTLPTLHHMSGILEHGFDLCSWQASIAAGASILLFLEAETGRVWLGQMTHLVDHHRLWVGSAGGHRPSDATMYFPLRELHEITADGRLLRSQAQIDEAEEEAEEEAEPKAPPEQPDILDLFGDDDDDT